MTKKLKKILFVDDDADIVNLAKYCLRELDDVETRFLNSGSEALKHLFDIQPDLIILDVMMPEISGIDVLRALRKLPGFHSIPVIFITGVSDMEELEEHRALGIAGIIKKPFNALTLVQEVRNIWNNFL